jgi:hypothetical protein
MIRECPTGTELKEQMDTATNERVRAENALRYAVSTAPEFGERYDAYRNSVKRWYGSTDEFTDIATIALCVAVSNKSLHQLLRPSDGDADMDENSEKSTTPDDPLQKPLTPEAASVIGTVLGSLFDSLGKIRETTEKYHAGEIAYMERIVILAGGTLTLTLSAIATISTHIHEVGHSAIHPRLIIYECWSLVVTITSGLLYSRLMLKIRQANDWGIVFNQSALIMKMKVLEAVPGVDLSKLAVLNDLAKAIPTPVGTIKQAKVLSVIVHFSLTVAFICLAFFIQSNIVEILTLRTR